MRTVTLSLAGTEIRADLDRAYDLAIPLRFTGAQPSAFGAPPASAVPLAVCDFVGDVAQGGSCNCFEYRFVPHCNGTHTECVGHVTRQPVQIHEIKPRGLEPALLLSVETVSPDVDVAAEMLSPDVDVAVARMAGSSESAGRSRESSDPPPQAGDRLITAWAIAAAWQRCAWPEVPVRALVLRTLPNDAGKPTRRYAFDFPPPYLTREAAQWLVAQGIEHLLLDVPSMDRLDDGGHLTAHRIFWGLPPGSSDAAAATRAHATITELVFADDAVPDGRYLLDLQIAAFAGDAAPSRPILYPAIEEA